MSRLMGRRGSALSPALAPIYMLPSVLRGGVLLPDRHRDRGMHHVGGSGSGKSLTTGFIAFCDFLRRTPQIVFDPLGQTVDAFLLRIARLPKPIRQRLWPSIIYMNMGGRGPTTPAWPLLFELPGDSRKDISERFLETCLAIDSALAGASIQGFNALYRVGAPVGIILSSLGLQLDQALDLLDRPESWESRLDEAVGRHPEARTAVDNFRRDYMALKPGDRLTLSQSYRAKVLPILLDPRLRALLCAPAPSIDLDAVIRNRQTVLLDFRGLQSPRSRVLATRWAYDTILSYIRYRGPGRHRPLAIHFDEIVELTDQGALNDDRFARDLDYLLNVLMRNSNLWVTASHQAMGQLGQRSQETLLAMGTQIFGLISDGESAELLARRYMGHISVRRPKRMHNVWISHPLTGPEIIEREPVDYAIGDQVWDAAQAFHRLKPFEFYIKPRDKAHVYKASIAQAMGAPWPNESQAVLEYIRYQLSLRANRTYPLPDLHIVQRAAEPHATIENYATPEKPFDEGDVDDWEADAPL